MAQTSATRARKGPPMPPPAPPADDTEASETPTNGAAPAADPTTSATDGEQTDPFVFLRSFSLDEWRNLTLYLYRTHPITNRRGGEVNIGVFQTPIDQQDVMKEHGSGDYRMDLVIDPPGQKRRRLRQMYFSVLHPEHPPKIPLGEWADDARNAKWAWAKNSTTNGVTGGAGGQMNPEGIIRTVFEYIEKARPNVSKEDQTNLTTKIVEMVKEDRQKLLDLADPSKQLTTLKNLLTAIAPPKDDTMGKFIDMLVKDREKLGDELKSLRESITNRAPEKGFFDQLLENSDKLEKVKSFFGGGAGASKTDWGEVALTFGNKLLDAAAPVAVALIQRMPAPGQNQRQQQQQQPNRWPPQQPRQVEPGGGGQQQQHQQPAAAAPAAAPAAAGPEPTQEMPPMPANMTAEEMNILMRSIGKYGALIQQCIPFMIDQYRAGLTGYDFRDWFQSRHGVNWWSSMKTELTAVGLIAAAKYDPQLWEALQPEDKALKFFQQFFTDEGDEELPDSEHPPAEGDDDGSGENE